MTRLSFLLRREWLSLIFGGVLVMLVLSGLLGKLGARDLLALRHDSAALEAHRDQLAADNTEFRNPVQTTATSKASFAASLATRVPTSWCTSSPTTTTATTAPRRINLSQKV